LIVNTQVDYQRLGQYINADWPRQSAAIGEETSLSFRVRVRAPAVFTVTVTQEHASHLDVFEQPAIRVFNSVQAFDRTIA
jgi:hypothetical protein